MNDLWNQDWWGNPAKLYFMVAGLIGLIWLIRRYISRFIAGLLFGVVHRIWKDVDRKSFVSLVVKPLGFFLAVLVSIAALYKLRFPEPLNAEIYRYTVRELVQAFGTILLIVYFIGFLIRLIDFIALILEKRANLTPDQTDNQLIVFFKDFFKVILVIIGIMLVLRYAFNQNIGGLLTGLSIVGAAIALALRESLENLIASFIIFFDKPFVTGDLVKVQSITGTVERIGLRSTRIRTDQKTYVTMPNKQMVDSILDNLSLRTQRRADLKLEIGLTTPSATVEELLKGLKGILEGADIAHHQVHLADISQQALVILVEYYTEPIAFAEFLTVKQRVNLQSLQLLEKLGIEIAGASTDIRVVEGKGQ